MKKNYIFLLLAILFSGPMIAQESQKNFINYQGVARSASNELMVNETMEVSIGIKFGSASASAVYEENHNITTDGNGVFSLLIGNGSAIVGNYNTLAWGSGATFVTVTINGNIVGTTEMMAVPYAISAGNMTNPSANEVPYDNSTSGLTAMTTQDAIDELVTSGSVDADADPSNEFQTLSFDAGTNELSLSDGNSVTIPSGGTDADADPANELQTLSFDAATNELSLSDGGTVIIPSGGTDADADSTNEIQDISLVGTELSISDGSTIDFAPILPPGGTDDQNLTFDGATNMLEIEDGNSVDLSSLAGIGGSSLWNEDDNGISRTSGQVGIGHQSGGDAKLFVQNAVPDIRNGIRASVFNNGYKAAISASAEARGDDSNNTFGVRSNARAESNGTAWAYRGDIGGAGTGRKYGLDLIFFDGTGGEKYGVYSKGENKNYFSGDLGLGIEDPTTKLDVDGSIRSRDLSGTGQRNVMADANGNLVIGSGGGSSLWASNGEAINYNSGNVGIGTDSPAKKLHIVSADSDPARFETTGDQSWVSFFNTTGYVGYAGVFTGNRDMDFGTGFLNATGKVHLTTNATPKLTVVPNGDVGIGTTNPSVKLDVAGDIKTSGEINRPTTGNANMIPIAYGSIDRDGRIFTGTENFTVEREDVGVYRIFITGEDYDFRDYIVSITRNNATIPGFIGSNSAVTLSQGYLAIRSYDLAGNLQSIPFTFVVYKP